MKTDQGADPSKRSESNWFRAGEWPLILVLVVSALILLAALINLNAPDIFRSRAEVDRRRAEMTMMSIEGSIEMYTLRNRRLPQTLEDLKEEDPKSGEAWLSPIPADPWGTPYQYTPLGGKRFRILSFGADRQEGTEDDIAWPPPS